MKNKNSYTKKVLSFVILILISALIGYYVGKQGVHILSPIPKPVKMWVLLLFIPTFFIVIAFHEAGHALAGVLLKFDFKMFVVGPFMWEKESSGWVFKWNTNVNTAGGMVVCLPTGDEKLASRFSVYALAGPFASLLLTCIAYVVFMQVKYEVNQSTALVGVVKYFALFLAIMSLLVFLVTIVPFRTGGFSSDGARAIQLLSGGDKGRFELLMLKIIASTTGGVRPCLLNKMELEEASELAVRTGSSMGVYISGIQHQVEFDGGSLEKAEKYLENYISDIDKIPEGIRNGVWIDAAFFHAFGRGNLNLALDFWNKFKPSAIIAKAQVLATEAAIHSLKLEYEIAREKISAARLEVPNMIDKGVGIALIDKLDELEKRIDAET